MEHATIKEIANGYFKIIPDKGYILLNKVSNTVYTEAVTKNIDEFEAIQDIPQQNA